MNCDYHRSAKIFLIGYLLFISPVLVIVPTAILTPFLVFVLPVPFNYIGAGLFAGSLLFLPVSVIGLTVNHIFSCFAGFYALRAILSREQRSHYSTPVALFVVAFFPWLTAMDFNHLTGLLPDSLFIGFTICALILSTMGAVAYWSSPLAPRERGSS
jgi:hypothetical protein